MRSDCANKEDIMQIGRTFLDKEPVGFKCFTTMRHEIPLVYCFISRQDVNITEFQGYSDPRHSVDIPSISQMSDS